MENVALMDKLLKYSEDRSRFGKGPERPSRTGHCSNDTCGDAVGVRVWIRSETQEDGAIRKYVRDIWWSGTGCEYCLAAAAMLAERLSEVEIGIGRESHLILTNLMSEFAGMPPTRRKCVETAITAFERAINWDCYTRKPDWTDVDCKDFDEDEYPDLISFGDEY